MDSASPENAREALRPAMEQYADTQITDVLFDIFCRRSQANGQRAPLTAWWHGETLSWAAAGRMGG
jgi:hypothetical protein